MQIVLEVQLPLLIFDFFMGDTNVRHTAKSGAAGSNLENSE